VVVQSKSATRQVWQGLDSVGDLPDRHAVTQLFGWPMQLVPQLVTCVDAVPSMTMAQSPQSLHFPAPPGSQRYWVEALGAGNAG
jgi:hypothetical protein